jgi:hypothetical protein
MSRLARRAMLATQSAAYDTDAAAYFAAMTVQPDATRKGLINTLIVGLKADGVWASLDVLYLLASHDAQAARLNAKAPATFAATAVNSPTFTTDRGYAGDGSTSYLNTGYTPSTAGGQFVQNSASFGVYVNAGVDTALTAATAMGAGNSNLVPRRSGDFVFGNVSSGTVANFIAATTRFGLTVLNRTASAVSVGYRTGVGGTNMTAASAAVATVPFFIGGLNTAGSLAGAVNNRVAVALIGAGMNATLNTALNSRLSTFLTAIGAN